MLFIPRNTTFKKYRKGQSFNKINSTRLGITQLTFGVLGLKSMSAGRIESKQLNAIRQSISKIIKKLGRVRINSFPHIPVTKKPNEIRMGKGKGNVDHWVCKVRAGDLLCEVETTYLQLGIKALETARIRLPLKTRIIYN